MIIPRGGIGGRELRKRGAGYSLQDNAQNTEPTLQYLVPFVGQHHGNLCGDASAMMLYRWAAWPTPLARNLAIDGFWNTSGKAFFQATERYKMLAVDKLRDEAVRIFKKYLLPESPDSIISNCHIEIQADAYQALKAKVDECVARKEQRDRDYAGIMNRWQRHITKAQGYVVGPDLFQPLVKALCSAFFASDRVGELIYNPRLTPFSGISRNNFLVTYPEFENCELRRSAGSLRAALQMSGPLVCSMGARPDSGFITSLIQHFVVITGFRQQGDAFFYHDPWRGPNKCIFWSELATRGNTREGFYRFRNPSDACFNRVVQQNQN